MTRIGLCLLLALWGIFGARSLQAQNGGLQWYFGNQAGLNFTTYPPTPMFDSQLSSIEGCATYTDEFGNLLMYTEGLYLRNRLHQPMPNGVGLLGDISSSQSCIIVPMPGSDSLFYVFTTEAFFSPTHNLYYSVVDMSLDGGLGDVVLKNVLVQTNTTEQISFTRHANGTDFWIVVHGLTNNTFSSYWLHEYGLETTPVNTSIGPASSLNLWGQIRFSPNGTRLAYPFSPEGYISLFDFDKNTGAVSNNRVLPLGSTMAYGIEFSASGRYLYASSASFYIYQWDLISNNTAAIIASKQQIVNNNQGFENLYSLQRARGGKIYVAKTSQYIGVINAPEQPGFASNYVSQGINLAPKNCSLGLPNYNHPPNPLPFDIYGEYICSGKTMQFYVQTYENLTNYQWDFGDPASGNQNTSTDSLPTHFYASPGSYNVTLTALAYGVPYSQTIAVQVKPTPQITFNQNSPAFLCGGQPLQLTASVSTPSNIRWLHNGQMMTFAVFNHLTISQPGTYQVIATTASCTDTSDVIQVLASPAANAIVSPQGPVTLCAGQSVLLNGSQSTGTGHQWLLNGQPIATGNLLTATAAGDYALVMSPNSGCSDTSAVVQVTVLPPPSVNLSVSGNLAFCEGQTALLSVDQTNGAQYQWLRNDTVVLGATSHEIALNSSGSYQAIVTDQNSCTDTSAAVQVTVYPIPDASVLPAGPLTFCEGDSVVLQSMAVAGNSYQWFVGNQPLLGATEPDFTAYSSGNYSLVVTSANQCPDTTTAVAVTVHPLPEVEVSPTGLVNLCAGDSVILAANNLGFAQYTWLLDNQVLPYTTPQIAAYSPGTYEVQVTNQYSCTGKSSAVKVVVHQLPDVTLLPAGNVNLCEGDQVQLMANTSGAYTYQWLHNQQPVLGATGTDFTASNPGSYQYIIYNQFLCSDTSVQAFITTVPRPTVSIVPAYGPGCADPILLTANGAEIYVWSSGQTGDVVSVPPAEAGIYSVTGQNQFGCTGSEEITVTALPCETTLFIPNIITPNNDGVNDVFMLGNTEPGSWQVSIFNRWGKQVFTSVKYQNDWSGTDLPDGVYYYQVQNPKTGAAYRGFVEIHR